MKFTINFLVLISIFSFIGCDKNPNSLTSVAVTPTIEPAKTLPVEDKIVSPKTDLKRLREWIGKYPINPKDRKYENFFQLPEVRDILVKILTEKGFQNLLTHFNGTELIKEKDGFLVMLGTTEKNANQDVNYGLVALNPETKETHVFFSDDKKLTSFSNTKSEGNLTAKIRQEILIYTDLAQSELIGVIKQKPAEGFQCYAVLPKDWEIIAEKRPYIFVMNDTSGTFNIEGKDVEIKKSDSSETKGENGKTYVEWIYQDKSASAKFDISVEKLLNDGADVQYNGTLTVTTETKTQTIQIRAFCGG